MYSNQHDQLTLKRSCMLWEIRCWLPTGYSPWWVLQNSWNEPTEAGCQKLCSGPNMTITLRTLSNRALHAKAIGNLLRVLHFTPGLGLPSPGSTSTLKNGGVLKPTKSGGFTCSWETTTLWWAKPTTFVVGYIYHYWGTSVVQLINLCQMAWWKCLWELLSKFWMHGGYPARLPILLALVWE